MESLAGMHCEACRPDSPRLTDAEIAGLLEELPGWHVVVRPDGPRLERTYGFRDFAQALAFTRRLGELAESEGHHPSILTEWGSVTVRWWTHVIRGLHRNDFIMAAKTDALAAAPESAR